MTPLALLRNALQALLPIAVASTVWLYLYPVFLGCAFPLPGKGASAAFESTIRQHGGNLSAGGSIAPFRLLALGDPQLEGDTSIPNAHSDSFPHLWGTFSHLAGRDEDCEDCTLSVKERVRHALHDQIDFYLLDIPNTLESIRKRIDLFGNDYYLAHIYRTLRWWTKPSHVTVLGDLLGSQWIDDEEFEIRSWRFWNRAFRGGERVPDDVAAFPAAEYDLAGYLETEDNANATIWRNRLINVVGNHDIGYAGDINKERIERFERTFGKVGYELRFEVPLTRPNSKLTVRDSTSNPYSDRLAPELRIVVINDMNLDTPVLEQDLQDETYNFINNVIGTASAVEFKGHFTVVLTHVPLFKREGICVDSPFFDFFSSDEGGGVKEQNQLSADASKGFIEGIFGLHPDPNAPGQGMGRKGVILNGHDHEGCDTYHYINQSEGSVHWERHWQAMRWADATEQKIPGQLGIPGLREITVRSMMGGFGGNAGLLSAWFNETDWEWRFEYTTCPLGKQYGWWTVHIVDLIVIVGILLYAGLMAAQANGVDVDRWPVWLIEFISRLGEKAKQVMDRHWSQQSTSDGNARKKSNGRATMATSDGDAKKG